ncbi:MAG: hypothetical protein JRF61_13975 [Deltaproteobacteria bacterium]|nr:hypothetical protein [Deltaproteobacteria bacterium]
MCVRTAILALVITSLLLLALAVLVVRRLVTGYPAPPPGLGILHRGEAAFVESAADVLFPGGAGLPVEGSDAHLPHYVDRHLAALPRMQRLQIRALFACVEHLTLFVPGEGPGGHRRFSSLSAASRVSILSRLAAHRIEAIRTLFIALRAVLVLGYLGHPANLRELGVAPFEIEPAVSDAELLFPRIGALVSSIALSEADRTDPVSLPPLDPHGPRHRAYLRSSRDSR